MHYLILNYLIFGASLLAVVWSLWRARDLFFYRWPDKSESRYAPLPEHLEKKAAALYYEALASSYERQAQTDPRVADFAQYYREEFNKRKHWLEESITSPPEGDPLSSALARLEPCDFRREP